MRGFEASLDAERGRARRAGFGRPPGPWLDLAPEPAFDLDVALRRGRIDELEPVADEDDPDLVWGDVWWLAYADRDDHVVVRRDEPGGAARRLLVDVMAVLEGVVDPAGACIVRAWPSATDLLTPASTPVGAGARPTSSAEAPSAPSAPASSADVVKRSVERHRRRHRERGATERELPVQHRAATLPAARGLR